jgi:hypothetical protein
MPLQGEAGMKFEDYVLILIFILIGFSFLSLIMGLLTGNLVFFLGIGFCLAVAGFVAGMVSKRGKIE